MVPPAVVAIEMTEPVGDIAPDRSILACAAVPGLTAEGLGGGRIVCFFEGAAMAGRGIPAIQFWSSFVAAAKWLRQFLRASKSSFKLAVCSVDDIFGEDSNNANCL